MNLEDLDREALMVGYACEACRAEIEPRGAFARLAPWVDQIHQRWTHNKGPRDYAEAVVAAQEAVSRITDVDSQIDLVVAMNGPTVEDLLERDLIRAMVGQLNTVVAQRVEELLHGPREVEMSADAADALTTSMQVALDYPNQWAIDIIRERPYYLEPLAGLEAKLNVPTTKGTA